jgi:type I restriction enzyme M protein
MPPTTSEPIETQLWRAADKLRKNIDAAEYKHVVLGLIFLSLHHRCLRSPAQ